MEPLDEQYVHLYKEIGKRVRVARQAANMTQFELAKSIRLNRTSVTNIEKGRQKLLVHTLLEISQALRVPASALLAEDRFVEMNSADVLIPPSLTERDRAIIEAAISQAEQKGS